MSKKIIEAMNGYVVEMTEERAKKARKMIEAKGMKVCKSEFKVKHVKHLYFRECAGEFAISHKEPHEQLMPWKQFKSMFQKKKKRGIEIITFGIDFGAIGSGLNTKNHLSDAFDYLTLKRMQPINAEKFENATTDTPKPEKEQEIDWSKKGQLVVYENSETSFVIKTDGTHSGTSFGGVVTKNIKESYWSIGYVSNGWNKSLFKPYTENLTDFEKLDPIVRELMLFEQVRQGNKRNEEVFKKCFYATSDEGGFNWDKVFVNDEDLWQDFYDKHTKQESLIKAYKAKASEHPELMDIFSRFAPLEHVVEDNEVIDWSKIQVVESPISKIITSGRHKKGTFSGMFAECINSNLNGTFADGITKEGFKLCKDQTIKFD